MAELEEAQSAMTKLQRDYRRMELRLQGKAAASRKKASSNISFVDREHRDAAVALATDW